MRQPLPDSVVAYKRTADFTESTVPRGLTANHRTKDGVWGKLVVTGGALGYCEEDHLDDTIEVGAGDHVVIPPAVPHRVVIRGPVSFYVEFYRAPR